MIALMWEEQDFDNPASTKRRTIAPENFQFLVLQDGVYGHTREFVSFHGKTHTTFCNEFLWLHGGEHMARRHSVCFPVI
jgi:hypothetical protein